MRTEKNAGACLVSSPRDFLYDCKSNNWGQCDSFLLSDSRGTGFGDSGIRNTCEFL